MSKLAAIFFTFVAATLVLFAALVYLMTQVNPPRLHEADEKTAATTETTAKVEEITTEAANVMLLGLTNAMRSWSRSDSNSQEIALSASKNSEENEVTEVKRVKGRRSIKTMNPHWKNNPSIVLLKVVDKEGRPRIEVLFYPKRSNKWKMYKKHNVLGPDRREMSSIIKIMPDDSIVFEHKLERNTEDITSSTKFWYTSETSKTIEDIFELRKDESNSIYSEIKSITKAGHIVTRTLSSEISEIELHSKIPNLNIVNWGNANIWEQKMKKSDENIHNEEPRSNLTENVYINKDITNSNNILYTGMETTSLKESLINQEMNSSEETDDVEEGRSELKYNKKKSISKTNYDFTLAPNRETVNIWKNEIKTSNIRDESQPHIKKIINDTGSITRTDILYTRNGISLANESSVNEEINSSKETQTPSSRDSFEIDLNINDNKIKSITLASYGPTRTPPISSLALHVNITTDMNINISKEALSDSYDEIEKQNAENVLLSKAVANNESVISKTRIVNTNEVIANTSILYLIKNMSNAKGSPIKEEMNGNKELQIQSYKNVIKNTNDILLSATSLKNAHIGVTPGHFDKLKTSTVARELTHTKATDNVESTDIPPATQTIAYINSSNANFNLDTKTNFTAKVKTTGNGNVTKYSNGTKHLVDSS